MQTIQRRSSPAAIRKDGEKVDKREGFSKTRPPEARRLGWNSRELERFLNIWEVRSANSLALLPTH